MSWFLLLFEGLASTRMLACINSSAVLAGAGNKTKEDLIREREARFRLKQSTLQR